MSACSHLERITSSSREHQTITAGRINSNITLNATNSHSIDVFLESDSNSTELACVVAWEQMTSTRGVGIN